MLNWVFFITLLSGQSAKMTNDDWVSSAALGLKAFEKISGSKEFDFKSEDISEFEIQMAESLAEFLSSPAETKDIQDFDFSELQGRIEGLAVISQKNGLGLQIFFSRALDNQLETFALLYRCELGSVEEKTSELQCEVKGIQKAELLRPSQEASKDAKPQSVFSSFHYLKSLKQGLLDDRINEVKKSIREVKVWKDRANIRAKTLLEDFEKPLFSYCHYHGKENFDCHASSREGQNEPQIKQDMNIKEGKK